MEKNDTKGKGSIFTEDVHIGSTVSFGEYRWLVLDIRGDMALILTENIIDQRSYHDAYQDSTWAECALRDYLNHAFCDCFSSREKERIVPVINSNPDNHWYGSPGGADTEDRVFLLSLEEVTCKYFGDSSSFLLHPGKNQRYWFERKDPNNSKRVAKVGSNGGGICWWWLRTPGRVSVKSVYVHGDGNIGIQGNNILKGNIADGRCTGGVRPALWLRLD